MKAFNQKTDHELIHLFTDGNPEALEALVLRHKDKLVYINSIPGKRQISGRRYFPGCLHPHH